MLLVLWLETFEAQLVYNWESEAGEKLLGVGCARDAGNTDTLCSGTEQLSKGDGSGSHDLTSEHHV